MKRIILIILTALLDLLAIVFLFFTYGPISYFRDLWITTAMTTMNHRYLANVLYDENTIYRVLSQNYLKEVEENTDPNQIQFNQIVESEHYESIYEEQILKKDEGNDLYKVIPLSGNTYKGYMVIVYDPSHVSLVASQYLGNRGELLTGMAARLSFEVGINAGGFVDPGGYGNGGIPTGTVIQNGQITYRGPETGWTGGLIGFTYDNILMLTKDNPETAIANGMRDAVEFGPFLIVNGKRAVARGNGGWGISSRTVIAQRQDGIVLFLIIDGRQPGYSIGIDMVEMTNLLVRYKAYNAANLDGGASTDLVIGGKLINRPCGFSANGERWLPNAWIVK